MKEQEISIFIDTMEDMGDPWTPKEVRDSEYFEMPLKEAIAQRKIAVDLFHDGFASAVDYLI